MKRDRSESKIITDFMDEEEDQDIIDGDDDDGDDDDNFDEPSWTRKRRRRDGRGGTSKPIDPKARMDKLAKRKSRKKTTTSLPVQEDVPNAEKSKIGAVSAVKALLNATKDERNKRGKYMRWVL